MMTQDDIQEIKDLLNDESDKCRLDAGDWIGYVEELIDEIDRQRSIIDELKAAMRGAVVNGDDNRLIELVDEERSHD